MAASFIKASLVFVLMTAPNISSANTPVQEDFLNKFVAAVNANSLEGLYEISFVDGLTEKQKAAVRALQLGVLLDAAQKKKERTFSFHEMDESLKRLIAQLEGFGSATTIAASQAIWVEGKKPDVPLKMALGEKDGKLFIVCFRMGN